MIVACTCGVRTGRAVAYVLGTAVVSKMSLLWCDAVVAVIVVIIVVERPIRGKISKKRTKNDRVLRAVAASTATVVSGTIGYVRSVP